MAAAAGWLTFHQYSCGSEAHVNAVLESGRCRSLIRPLWITWAVGRYIRSLQTIVYRGSNVAARVDVMISDGSAVEKGSCLAGEAALAVHLSSLGHFQLRLSFPHHPERLSHS